MSDAGEIELCGLVDGAGEKSRQGDERTRTCKQGGEGPISGEIRNCPRNRSL